MAKDAAERNREELISSVWDQVDAHLAGALLAQIVAIPSPVGEERELAEFLVTRLEDAGIEGRVQPVGDGQANALGAYGAANAGPRLLLYAPIDVPWRGTHDELPMLGNALTPAFVPEASWIDGQVVGLGAENPKSFAACVLAAAEAVARAGVSLDGQLLVGLGAGGMPVGPAPGVTGQIGHGVGCERMLDEVRPDCAVVAKPGFDVAYEEVGLCWFRVEVRGTLGYTGVRHIVPYRSAIVDAALLVDELERWFETYTDVNTSGAVAPQAAVGSIKAGEPEMAAFTPATCELVVDVRVSPRTSIADVESQFGEAMAAIAARLEIELEWETVLAIPGATTAPDHWIIRSAISAWERVAGRPHEFRSGASGSTDAIILRGRGVPTARIGMPRVDPPDTVPGFTMGTADPEAMTSLIRCLCAIVIETLTRSRADLGLAG